MFYDNYWKKSKTLVIAIKKQSFGIDLLKQFLQQLVHNLSYAKCNSSTFVDCWKITPSNRVVNIILLNVISFNTLNCHRLQSFNVSTCYSNCRLTVVLSSYSMIVKIDSRKDYYCLVVIRFKDTIFQGKWIMYLTSSFYCLYKLLFTVNRIVVIDGPVND